jgi:putative membrane protein
MIRSVLPSPSTVRRAGSWLPTVATTAAMIATPLVARGGGARRALSSVVVTGLAVTTGQAAARRWPAARVGATAAGVAAATALVERIGTRTGLPFGRYEYTDALRPRIGDVPAIVPLAWFAMAVPSREAAHAALGTRSTPVGRVLLGAAALTAWDLFLDPQMVGEGYWRWARQGRYRGIPASNYVGWFVTSALVMAALERALPTDVDTAPEPALVGVYGTMAGMETLGFAAFFGDRTVAACGGAAMVPLALAAARRVIGG